MKRAAFVLALLAAACTTSDGGGGRTREIAGTVAWEQPATVPPGAEFHVALVDGSEPGTPVVAETRFTSQGEGPAAYSIAYDPSLVSRAHHYYLRASVIDPSTGEIRLATAEDVAVIPGTLNAIELIVTPVQPAASTAR